MSDLKHPKEMSDQEILDEYDATFGGVRTYGTHDEMRTATIRKDELKREYEGRQVDPAKVEGPRAITRRAL